MPRIEATWSEIQVDRTRLSSYRQACSITGEPGLPMHYPHVLVSAMHLNMLTEKEFPLKLLGAVHLRNHAIRYRVIEEDETLDLKAAIVQCRFRPQGYEFDLDTHLSSKGEKVWVERTTLLVRKNKLSQETPASALAEVFPWNEEAESEEACRFDIPSDAGRRFAAITGDYNPIHVSKALARMFGFKRDLVHGMWGVARATAGLELLQSGDPVRVDVAFKGPLFMESDIVVRKQDCNQGQSLRLFCGSEPRPAVQIVVRKAGREEELDVLPSRVQHGGV